MSTLDVESGNPRLSFRDVAPVEVRVQDLAVEFSLSKPWWAKPVDAFSAFKKDKSESAGTKTKVALHGVSARLPSGSLTAILGGSGSGKTTLLNTISSRVTTSRLRISGTTTFNGDQNLQTVSSAYVMQQDVLLPTLSPRETLQYAADLRLPSPSTREERRSIVEQVILELGLKECADTRIGNSSRKGCSGGEKRRTSIGVQMLANPSVLFCDEPTTGLDAYSAFQVVQTLKALANGGRTVIISIHAPRSEIWRLFDRVILLSRGHTLYSGLADAAVDHFSACGHFLPPFVNPAEFLIDLAAIDTRTEEAEKATGARVEILKEAWATHLSNEKSPVTTTSNSSALSRPIVPSVSFSRQVRILTERNNKVTIRDPLGITGSLCEAISMGIITGWVFLNLPADLSGIRSREGSVYNATSLQPYLILLFECYRLTFDIQLFDREHNEGVVTPLGFLISRRLSRVFLEDLPVPIIFSLIYYFMNGFRLEAATFFIFLAVMIITHFISVTAAMFCVSISRDFAGSSLIANLIFTVQSLACGFFVQSNQIPVYTQWLKWIAYNFYTFGVLITNEFIGVHGGPFGQFYDCPFEPKDPLNPACRQYVGSFIVQSLGVPMSNWLWRPIVITLAYPIGFYFAAWAILNWKRVSASVARAQSGNIESSTRGDAVLTSSEKFSPITVRLQDYALGVRSRRMSNYFRSTTKEILQPLKTTFEPGKLNVIMGPSGSGKTSLLQSIALRLSNSFSSKYTTYGEMMFNGTVPSDDVVKSIVCFVTQDDDALMPSLTVRETLYFAAGLRLPWKLSKDEKKKRAEDIMLKLGLRDAADNLIGSDLKKGISGGEKRRVSIAIQILTDPKILLLDEPTSGLDAFTAVSILEVLRGLADEGRTIIMTIHQARADVFGAFQNILLLARGGAPIYSGPGEGMLPHFSSFGYDCPRTSNPADFALDLITVDLQEEQKEAASREKVGRLVQAWEDVQKVPATGNSKPATAAELTTLKRKMNPFWTTFPIVLRRSVINLKRQPELLLGRIMQVVSISVIYALFFAPVQSNYEAVQTRMGYVAELGALYFVGMLQNLSIYPVERALFYREDLDHCYTVFTFLLSYTTLEVPFEIASGLVFGVLTAFAIQLKQTAQFFLIASFNCFAIISCGESVGIIFCTIFSQHQGFSVTIMSVFLSIANILGGILSVNVPAFLQAWNWLSPVKYMLANVAQYSLRDTTFTCDDAQRSQDGQCPISTGEEVLKLYKFDGNPGLYLLGLGICVVVYRLVALSVLWVARNDLPFRARKSRIFKKGVEV